MTGVIATIPKFQFLASNGTPLSGGSIDVYLAGTTTRTSTWQDQALTIANTNPVRLDARGECVVFLDSTKTYKVVLKNAAGVSQWTQDNVTGTGVVSFALNVGLINTAVTDAQASAAASLSSLNDFKGRYYGALDSDPSVDPLGNPVTTGDAYFNSVANLFKVYNGAAWQASDINTANLAAPTGSSLVGANGETVEDALERAEPYRVNNTVDLLIVYGQSNAKGYAATSAGDPVYKTPLARVWNGAAFIALTSYTPTSIDGTSTGSAWAAFGNEYCKSTGRKLVILNCAKGSQSLTELQKGAANYTGMTAFVAGALAALTAEGSTVGKRFVAFSQGERDSQLKTTPAAYTALLTTLWTDMKSDFAVSLLGVYTVGYYADSNLQWGQAIQLAQRLFARSNTDVVIAYDHLGAFGSHNKLKVDSVHYNQQGYNIMGREGAKRLVSVLFDDTNAPSTDQHIERFGRISLNQSQAWNMHAGVIQKSTTEPGWVVSHTSPRSHSLITEVDAATSDTVLNVKLACPARTILSFNAGFGGVLQAVGIRAAIGSSLTLAPTAWATPTVDGFSIVPIMFHADVCVRLNLATQVMDNAIMGSSLASLIDQFSATWSTGQVIVTHPSVIGFPSVNIVGSTGKTLRVNAGATSTIIQVRNLADALVDDTLHVVFKNVPIRHIDLPTTTELSIQIIAADYAVW